MTQEEKNKRRGGKPGVARRISALVALPLWLLGKTLMLMVLVPLALLSTVLLFPLGLLVGLYESRGGIAGWILGRVPGDDVMCSLVATLLSCLDPLGGWADIWERTTDREWWCMIRGMALVVLGKSERADNNQRVGAGDAREGNPLTMAKRLYHATDAKNVESILKNGLLRCHGDHKSAFICLSEKPASWFQAGQTLLSVDIDGLDCKITSWIPDGLDEVCVWGDIPPNRIRITKGFN